jgi:DUF4097 and DUF4098 domain-containing protein YvlB
MTPRTCLLVCLVPAVLGSTACDISVPGPGSEGAEGRFDRTLTVAGPVDLEVRTGSGDVQVRAGGTGSVEVHGIVRAGFGHWIGFGDGNPADRIKEIEANPPIEQNGNTIRLGADRERRSWNNVSVSYQIVVPPGTKILARSGSGDVQIGEVNGPVDASTGSGDIRMGRVAEGVQANTGSGDIELAGARSAVARTGSGSIRALSIGGNLTAHSGSGDIAVAQEAAGHIDISTGSGSVDVRGARGPVRVRASSGDVSVAGTPSDAWDLSASSGSIDLQLAADAGFDLDAHTGSGSVESSFPISVSGEIKKGQLRGQVRGGGPRVGVSTSSGDIRIR